MDKTIYTLKVTLTEPLLGTQPQKAVAMEYIQAKAREAGIDVADENETLDEMVEKGTTVFHKIDGKPVYFDYMVKGFLKESAQVQNPLRGVRNLRSKIDNYVFIEPRMIPLILPEGKKIEFMERPLRAMTAQGPRVSLARSEMLPAGTTFECSIVVLKSPKGIVEPKRGKSKEQSDEPKVQESKDQITEEILRDLLDYGQFKGFGQWRGGSYGRFTYELTRQ